MGKISNLKKSHLPLLPPPLPPPPPRPPPRASATEAKMMIPNRATSHKVFIAPLKCGKLSSLDRFPR